MRLGLLFAALVFAQTPETVREWERRLVNRRALGCVILPLPGKTSRAEILILIGELSIPRGIHAKAGLPQPPSG